MSNIQELLRRSKGKKYFELLKNNLVDSDDSQEKSYCHICGELKKDFIDPNSGRLFGPLQCRCELDFEMLKKVWMLNLEIYGTDFNLWLNGNKIQGKDFDFVYKTIHFPAMKKLKDEIEYINKLINDRKKK